MSAIAFPLPNPDIMARRPAILAGLLKLLPDECVITSEDERRPYETDAFTAYRNMPLAVVLPRTTEEVSKVLKFCNEMAVPVIMIKGEVRGFTAGPDLWPIHAIEEENVGPSVAVVVDEGTSPALDLRHIHLAPGAVIVTPIDPCLGSDVDETGRFLRSGRGGVGIERR